MSALPAPHALDTNKDLPPLPLALGAYDHLTGNTIPIALSWALSPTDKGKWSYKNLAETETFKAVTATRPSVQILGDVRVTATMRPLATATTTMMATVVLAITPVADGKIDSISDLHERPGNLSLTLTAMSGAAAGTLGFFPGAQRNLKIPGALGHPWVVQVVTYGIGVAAVDLSLQFDAEVQGWMFPTPKAVVPFQ